MDRFSDRCASLGTHSQIRGNLFQPDSATYLSNGKLDFLGHDDTENVSLTHGNITSY